MEIRCSKKDEQLNLIQEEKGQHWWARKLFSDLFSNSSLFPIFLTTTLAGFYWFLEIWQVSLLYLLFPLKGCWNPDWSGSSLTEGVPEKDNHLGRETSGSHLACAFNKVLQQSQNERKTLPDFDFVTEFIFLRIFVYILKLAYSYAA